MNTTAKGEPSNFPLPDVVGLFRAIFEQAAVGVAQIETTTGRFLHANQRYGDIVGYSRQEMERLDFQTLTHPEDLATDLDNMRRLVAGEIREFTMEKRYRHKDGHLVWVKLTVSPLWMPGEPPTFHVAIVEDITRRKQTEEALRESEESFRKLYEASPDPILLMRGKCFIRCNRAALRFLGITDELRFLGSDPMDISPERQPDGRLSAEAALEYIAQAHAEGFCRFEWLCKTYADVPFLIEVTLMPIRLGGEQLLHITWRDITARKRVEAELRASESLLRAVVDNIPFEFWARDLEGRCTMENVALRAHWGSLLGQRPEDSDIAAEDLAIWLANNRRALAGEIIKEEVRYQVDGKTRFYHNILAPIRVGQEILGILGFNIDITEHKLAEEALRESEERLQLVMRGSQLGYWDWNLETNQVLRNERWAEMLGYDLHEIEFTVKQWIDFVHPEDQAAASQSIQDHLEGRTPKHRCEYRMRTKTGAYKWILDQAQVVSRDPSGRALRMSGTHTDITERKQSEAATRQRGEDLALLLEVTKTLATTLDLKTVMQAGTDGASRLLGLGSAAIYLMDGEWLHLSATTPPLPPELPESFGRAALADHPRIQEAISTNRPVLLPDTATATLTPAERTIIEARELRTILYLPLVASEQTLGTLIVGSLREPRLVSEAQIDLGRTLANLAALAVVNSRLYEAGRRHVTDLEWEVAERKRAESALRESEERLRMATDAARMGVWERDLKSDRLIWSPMAARLNDFEPGEFPGTEEAFRELLHPDSLNTYLAARQRLREGDGIYLAELRFRLRNGRERWGMVSGRLIRNANGQPERIVGIDMDITDRKRAEAEQAKLQAQLTHAQKMESVGRLAGGVAHDFNNMLQAILGHADLALQDIPPDSSLHEHLLEIKNCGQRSADLTRQLLAFARKQTIAPRVLDLNETIEGMLKMLRRLIGEDIDLAWKPGRDLWPVRIDPSQVDQVLANLCVNARDAIDGVGKVTIETDNVTIDEDYCAHHAGWFPGDYVQLAVSDNGCGMDAETLSHLFEPFFTTKDIGKGTGLGLATVYGVVKQNNGFVNVYSEPGSGTTFKIYLARHANKAVQETSERRPQATTRGSETILLVEDELAILKLTRRVLERLGYTVLAAQTPGEAIRLAREHAGQIDLLLTDVVMPEMNGRDLARSLLTIHPSIKRLFSSGYTADVIAHHGVLDPGVHFIQKPFSPQALGAKVREVLES